MSGVENRCTGNASTAYQKVTRNNWTVSRAEGRVVYTEATAIKGPIKEETDLGRVLFDMESVKLEEGRKEGSQQDNHRNNNNDYLEKGYTYIIITRE